MGGFSMQELRKQTGIDLLNQKTAELFIGV
jgi:hypothetical protein